MGATDARERGGLGLPITAWAAFYEEANRSIFGPVCLNCQAPDDGNMSLLDKVLPSASAKDRWLQPIIDGKVRSSFAMTEPSPGSGSDPGGMMLTRAERRGERYVVTGRKWFISGAAVASHFILIARTSEDPRRGLSAFLFHRDDPGWRIVRRIANMGPDEHGGVCELEFDGLETRSSTASSRRATGCGSPRSAWVRRAPPIACAGLGLAKRCLEIAAAYVAERRAFAMRLADHESVQMMLGEAAKNIQIGRLLTMHAAWCLDNGSHAQKEVSMAKLHVADTLIQAADVGLQLLGARGYSKDTPIEWIYRYARAAKLVDGASEVHRMLLFRAYDRLGDGFWRWGVP